MRVSPVDVGQFAVPYAIQYLGRGTWIVLYLIRGTSNEKNNQIERTVRKIQIRANQGEIPSPHCGPNLPWGP